jgi:hypothetical protein
MKAQLQLFLLNLRTRIEQTMKPMTRTNMFLPANSLCKILWLYALCTFASGQLHAQTDVSGTIVNQTWTSNNSPYIVVGDINVAGLTILPDVTVQFASNYTFEVDGVLQAQGTPNSPIIFMGTNGGWQGIFFNYSSPGSVLACCVISNSVNSGIRITNSSLAINNCLIASNTTPGNAGGGILASNAANDLVLQNCTVINNTCGFAGGGICALLGTSTLTMTGCVVSNNVANPSQSVGTAYGGGIYVSGNSLLKNCVVRDNTCQGDSTSDQAQYAVGGGLYSDTGTAVIENCVFAANTAVCSTYNGFASGWPAYAGGIYIHRGSLAIANSILSSNVASSSDGEYGGGLGVNSSPSVTNSSVINCTIAYNSTQGIYSQGAEPQVMNSILFFNDGNGTQISGATNVTYCDVQGGFAGLGNINRNPIFLSTTNLIIVEGSPCINAGSTNSIYKNVYFPPSLGVGGNDMGAHGGPGAGASLGIAVWPPAEVFFYGGVPGYNYLIQASTDLLNWQTVEPVQIANLGDIASFIEPTTNNLPHRFYKLNLAP